MADIQDPIGLELFKNSLFSIADEMALTICRTTYSGVLRDNMDFSTAFADADGKLVAQGLTLPGHLGSIPTALDVVIERFGDDTHPGDVFILNDPFDGGMHLPDIFIFQPIFARGERIAYAATICHHADVGGRVPGSNASDSTEIYQEGLRIVPTRICDRGRMNEAWLTLLFDNMRIARERRGDFNTMLGTSRKAAEHVGRLFARFGGAALLDAIEELIERAEKVMRERIARIPDGTYHAEGYLDSDGHGAAPLRGRLALTVAGDCIVADFSGSSPQTKGPTNVGPAMAFNAAASIVKSFLDPDTPVNHGSFNPIEIVNPPGSFLNATLPAPCGGMVECRALMCGLVVSALGQALPEKRVGDLKGGGNHVYVSGPHPDRNDIFLLYEYPAAGTGATGRTDGNHAVRAFPEGDFNAVQSAEVVEAQSPVRIESYGLREGSCGDGEFRGGLGLRRDVRVLADEGSLSVLADKNIIPPFGVGGGVSGAANRFTVVRGGETIEPSPVPGKVGGFALEAGDVVRMETSGGGGYGDPLARAPEKVLDDVALGYLSPEQAIARYGVVIDAGGGVDASATHEQRARLRASRALAPVTLSNESDLDGSRRRIRLPAALAHRLDVESGALVEIATPACGAALRGWAEIAERTDLALSAEALAALGADAGDTVEVRAVHVAPR
jgi:N-methylhydantoinase B